MFANVRFDKAQRSRRHLFAPGAHRFYAEDSLRRITEVIVTGELRHRGEICFAVESALPIRSILRGVTARDRAHEVFAQLRVWNTHANNGVLVYLLLADHRIEIVADRGLDALVSAEQWRGVCQVMEERLAAGEPEVAATTGVKAISDLLAAHFPRADGEADDNELPDPPRILG